jgi:ribosomal protein L40E|tara:strand:- start:6076 stop:6240 length:165 start_codon:yes stop_codon:yes gene_type:complete
MVRFPEATARLFHKIFVCKKCKGKIKADVRKVLLKKVSCRNCGGKSFRIIKSKR